MPSIQSPKNSILTPFSPSCITSMMPPLTAYSPSSYAFCLLSYPSSESRTSTSSLEMSCPMVNVKALLNTADDTLVFIIKGVTITMHLSCEAILFTALKKLISCCLSLLSYPKNKSLLNTIVSFFVKYSSAAASCMQSSAVAATKNPLS